MADYDQILSQLVSGDDDVGNQMYGAVGVDELVGIDELVGGPVSAQQLRHLGLLKQAGGVGVRQIVRDRVRMQWAPWPQESVAAGATETVTLQPQRLIQIKSLVIPSSLGTLFDLDDLRIQQITQFITTGRVSAQTLSEVADGGRCAVKLDSCDIGALIQLDFVNLDATNAQTVRGELIATSVY